MNPSEEFYLSKLYPLQDDVLKTISFAGTPFYLTGGTVIGRVYCWHRYSDDLDLFINHDSEFENHFKAIVNILKEKFIIEDNVSYDTFARIFIAGNDFKLKVEFVNDVKYRVGEVTNHEVFGKIDTWFNILVNKLTATTRNAAKDFSDILFLSYKYSFNWQDVISEMKKKDAWLDEVKVAENIDRFDISKFDQVNWIVQPDFDKLGKDLIVIAKDILLGNDNSLYKG